MTALPGGLPDELMGGPFDAATARAAGVQRWRIRTTGGRRIRWKVYAGPDAPDSLRLACDAAVLVLPAYAAFSHQTAAALFGLPIPGAPDGLHVTVPVGRTVPRLTGVVGHVGLGPADATRLDGRNVTTPARLFVDLSARLGLGSLVALGDAILAAGLAGRVELTEAVEAAYGKRGVVRARRALAALDERSASPMESRLRTLLVEAGLPRPEVNLDVRDRDGVWLARCDLVFPEAKVVVEYEGDQHRTDRAQWHRDIVRAEGLREAGWTVIRVTADDVFAHPTRTLDRVTRALNAPRS